MFQKACQTVRESVYGVVARSKSKKGKRIRFIATNGSGFMISPGIIATVAHVTHQNSKKDQPNHTELLVIRAPDLGSPFEKATLLVEDMDIDLAFLKIKKPKSTISVALGDSIEPRGTSCGSLGYPMAKVKFSKAGMLYLALERFLGGHISNVVESTEKTREIIKYETDYGVYSGSSGSPGFNKKGIVFGLHTGTVPLPRKQKRTTESGRIAMGTLLSSINIIEVANTNGIDI